MKYVRYEHQRRVSNGILDGETVREIQGGLFEGKAETGNRLDLRSVKLLWPCDPGKVLAVGLNYKSHLGNRPAPKNPEIFFKATSSLTEPEGAIVIPAGAQNVHFEGELVLVMGKKARRVSVSAAESRLNGEVKQSQFLSDLIFDPATFVSFVSQYVTLLPGDVIYTGTPGTTSAMKAGDVVEVEIDGIGTLRNKVVGS